jgi:hypothetical protein
MTMTATQMSSYRRQRWQEEVCGDEIAEKLVRGGAAAAVGKPPHRRQSRLAKWKQNLRWVRVEPKPKNRKRKVLKRHRQSIQGEVEATAAPGLQQEQEQERVAGDRRREGLSRGKKTWARPRLVNL